MSAPSPCNVMQTPQRKFAGAKVQQNFEMCKYLRDFFPDNPENPERCANLEADPVVRISPKCTMRDDGARRGEIAPRVRPEGTEGR